MEPNAEKQENKVVEDPEEKKKKFEELLSQQANERSKFLQEKRMNSEKNKDPREMMTVIQKNFREQYDAISQKLQTQDKASVKIDSLFEDYNKLHEYYVHTSYSLMPYDKQLYKDQLEKLEKSLHEFRESVQPKEKFSFKKKANADVKKKEENKSEEAAKKEKVADTVGEEFFMKIKGLENLKGEQKTLGESDLEPSYKLVGLIDCEINLHGKFKAVWIKNCTNCKINVGPVEGAVFVDNCLDSVLNLICHQSRIHNSKGVTFRLFVTSNPIIEYCTNLKFGKYNHAYEKLPEDLKATAFEGKENSWDQVQDFGWLKQEKSPNFELID